MSLKVIHFHNGANGGVSSVIQNLIKYKKNPNIDYSIIYIIKKELKIFFLDSHKINNNFEKVVYYSSDSNLYSICKRVSQLIPDDKTILVAHDQLELCMIAMIGLKNPVIQFLHGDYNYYYDLSKKYEAWIDCFIAVSESIDKKLKLSIPTRYKDIYYQRFPVPNIVFTSKANIVPKIVFIGRLTSEKGYFILPHIAKKLEETKIKVEWHIIGSQVGFTSNKGIWPSNCDVIFWGEVENQLLIDSLWQFDYVLLPSIAEGMPISIIECMKAGVIPIVNDLEGGIQELVHNGKTGFKINSNQVDDYAQTIINIESKPELKKLISTSARQRANEMFDPDFNSNSIELKITNLSNKRKNLPAKQLMGSKLDKPWIPDFATKTIRRLIKHLMPKKR